MAEIKAKEGAFIATIDVDSFYTNIDNTNGLEAVKQIFNKNPDPNRPDKKNNLENMILSSTSNGTYKRGELRWVRNLHQIMLICFWQSGRKRH